VTTTVNSSSVSTNSSRTIKFVQSVTLLLTAGFLFERVVDASGSILFRFNPNPTAALWVYLDIAAGLLLIPTAFAIFSSVRFATLASIGLATLAFSIFAAQGLLLLVDRHSDQTYLLLNQYLKDSNPIFPLVISIIAITISILRLKTYELS